MSGTALLAADNGIDPVSIMAGAANALPAGVGFKGAVDLLVLLTVLSLAVSAGSAWTWLPEWT